MTNVYSPEFRQRALRMMDDYRRGGDVSEWAAASAVGEKLGVSPHTMRGWSRRARSEVSSDTPASSAESEEIKELRREVRELKRANEILKTASVDSTGQRNSASSLSAGVSKLSVLRGRESTRAATLLRSSWVRSFMLTPLGKY